MERHCRYPDHTQRDSPTVLGIVLYDSTISTCQFSVCLGIGTKSCLGMSLIVSFQITHQEDLSLVSQCHLLCVWGYPLSDLFLAVDSHTCM